MAIKARNDKQRDVLRSNCDFVFITGAAGSGKTFAVSMYNSFDIKNNPRFSATYLRKNIGDFFSDGGIVSMMKEIYQLRSDKDRSSKRMTVGEILTSPQNMGVYFDNGASLRFKHISDERQEKLEPSFKGIQSNRFIFDEADEFQASTIFYVPTRLRGKGKGKRQIVIVQNPERECFTRQFCGNGNFGGGWIADDGSVIESMNGVVRFFHIVEGDINNVFWGNTKKEVYDKAKPIIDELVKDSAKLGYSYESFVFSCVFFDLSTKDNVEMLAENPEYLGSLAMSSGAGSMYRANWNYSKYDKKVEESESMLNYKNLSAMFRNMPNRGVKKRIVVDPARGGVDNFTMKCFHGFHCVDFWHENITKAEDIPTRITEFMIKHGAQNKDLIIDSKDGFEYIGHLFNGAFLYNGNKSVSNMGKNFARIRDEAAYMMCQMVERGLITYEPHLANAVYTHQKSLKKNTTLLLAMVEEAKCYIFTETEAGKTKLLQKDKQSAILGGRSTDLTDLLIMLCGGLIYDCYRELANKRTDVGVAKAWSDNEYNERLQTNAQVANVKKSKNIASIMNKSFGW